MVVHLIQYEVPEGAPDLMAFLACHAFILFDSNKNRILPTKLLSVYEVLNALGLTPKDRCEEMLSIADEFFFDGKDALQWSTYTINQGKHRGETILAIMGTDPANNVEQVITDLWSVPMATDMMRNMANEAREIALAQNATYITGHSLGGIIAEMVCSMTGIPGASFGAIGAFDPYSKRDEQAIDLIVNNEDGVQQLLDNMADELSALGFPVEDIVEFLDSYDGEDLKDELISLEYNGLIDTTYHDGVKFEVVLNTYDALARLIASADGSACSHIAQSCDVRWTWFGSDQGNDWSYFSEHTLGHSSAHYAYNTNSNWTRGYEDEATATIDRTKIFLPGVEKNLPCGFCDGGDYCESGICNSHYLMCEEQGGGIPTFCPATKDGEGSMRADCRGDNDCHSRRCEFHSNPFWAALFYYQCYDKLPNNSRCNENSDCQSGYCSWLWRCE